MMIVIVMVMMNDDDSDDDTDDDDDSDDDGSDDDWHDDVGWIFRTYGRFIGFSFGCSFQLVGGEIIRAVNMTLTL